MRPIRYFIGLAMLILLSAGVSSCSQATNSYDDPDDRLSGSGILVTEARETGNFTAIHSSGPITTVISQGDTREILVTADNNVLQRVVTTVHGNALYISLREGNYHNIWIRVKVVVPSLSRLVNNGSGSMKATQIDMAGELRVSNTANGLVILEGKAARVSLLNEGSGSINAFDLETAHCTVYNGGPGQCEVNCTTLLEGGNSGSGSITYMGNPTVTAENEGTGGISQN